MSPSVDKSSWLARVFEPKTDFFALLNIQSASTLEGMIALEAWINEGTFERPVTRRTARANRPPRSPSGSRSALWGGFAGCAAAVLPASRFAEQILRRHDRAGVA